MRPVLVVNPRSDASFVEFVREQLAGHPGDDPAALEGRLRQRHPAVSVRARVLANEPTTIWYVYRDGHWTLPETAGTEEEVSDHGRA